MTKDYIDFDDPERQNKASPDMANKSQVSKNARQLVSYDDLF